jgi:hypothetical protein
MNPWLGIGGVMVALVTFLVSLRCLQRRFSLHPELTRKMVHVGMGLVTLSFPYLFRSAGVRVGSRRRWPRFAGRNLFSCRRVDGLLARRRR